MDALPSEKLQRLAEHQQNVNAGQTIVQLRDSIQSVLHKKGYVIHLPLNHTPLAVFQIPTGIGVPADVNSAIFPLLLKDRYLSNE